MKKIIFPVLAAMVLMSPPAFSYSFSWKVTEGERIEMLRTASVRLYLNSMVVKRYRERNIVDLTCYGQTGSAAKIKGLFSIFHADEGSDIFRLESRAFSDFTISSDGKMTVPSQYTMPNFRNIPAFPQKDLVLNDTWSADGELVLDHLSKPVVMIFPVKYKFERLEKKNGRDCALLTYSFEINKNLKGMTVPDDFPLMIAGRDKGIIWWDIVAGKPADSSEEYKIMFLQPDGINAVEFQMTINGGNKVYAVVPPEEGEAAKKELEKDIGGKNGISVGTDTRGLVVRMGEVLFDIDSASLRKDTRTTLDFLIDAVKRKYPDREIIVEGHTDSTGDKSYNQSLSDKRAESVARYLSKGVGHDKFSYRGFGSDKPIADNATKEGREKNRRVEIVIKLN